MKDTNEINDNLAYDIKDDHYSFYNLLWWMRYVRRQAEGQNFVLHIDVDGPKFLIFLNTVFMNNFSIR